VLWLAFTPTLHCCTMSAQGIVRRLDGATSNGRGSSGGRNNARSRPVKRRRAVQAGKKTKRRRTGGSRACGSGSSGGGSGSGGGVGPGSGSNEETSVDSSDTEDGQDPFNGGATAAAGGTSSCDGSGSDVDSSDTEDGQDPFNGGATDAAWKRISEEVALVIPRVKWTVKRPTRVVFVDLSRRGKLSQHIATKPRNKRSAVTVEAAIDHICTPAEGMPAFQDVELKQQYKDRGIVLRRRVRVTGGHASYLQPLVHTPMRDFVVTPQYLLFIKDKHRLRPHRHLAVCSFGFNTYTQLSEYASKDFVAKLVVKFISESHVKELVEKSVRNQVTRSARRFKHATQLTPAKAWNTDVSKVVAPALGSRAAPGDRPTKWRKNLLTIFGVKDKRNDGEKRVRGLTVSAASAFHFTAAHPVETAVQLVDLLYAAGASDLSTPQKLLKGMLHPLKEASQTATDTMLKDVRTFLTGKDVDTLVVVAEPVQDEDSRMDFDAWVAGDWRFVLKGGPELDPPVFFYVGMPKVELLDALKVVWGQFRLAADAGDTPAAVKKYAKQLCIQRWEAHDNDEASPAEKPVLVSDFLQWVHSGERTVLQMEAGEVKQLSAGHIEMTRKRVKTWQDSAKLHSDISGQLQCWHLRQEQPKPLLHREDTFNFSHWELHNWVVGDCSTSASFGVELFDLM